jgi:hypothetical protein
MSTAAAAVSIVALLLASLSCDATSEDISDTELSAALSLREAALEKKVRGLRMQLRCVTEALQRGSVGQGQEAGEGYGGAKGYGDTSGYGTNQAPTKAPSAAAVAEADSDPGAAARCGTKPGEKKCVLGAYYKTEIQISNEKQGYYRGLDKSMPW